MNTKQKVSIASSICLLIAAMASLFESAKMKVAGAETTISAFNDNPYIVFVVSLVAIIAIFVVVKENYALSTNNCLLGSTLLIVQAASFINKIHNIKGAENVIPFSVVVIVLASVSLIIAVVACCVGKPIHIEIRKPIKAERKPEPKEEITHPSNDIAYLEDDNNIRVGQLVSFHRCNLSEKLNGKWTKDIS